MHLTAISQFVTATHGQGKINLELLKQLHVKGHSIEVICSSIDDTFRSQAGVHWIKVPYTTSLPTNWLRCEAFRLQAQRKVHGPVAINNGAAAIVPSKLSIAMFVHSAWLKSPFRSRWGGLQPLIESGFTRQQAMLEQRAFHLAETVVALSDQVRSELIEFAGIPDSKIAVIPPGVDAQRFRPRSGGEANRLRVACGMGGQDDRLLLLFVGEIRSNRKNLDLVLETVLRDEDLVLAVIGSTDRSPYLEMASRLDISERVHFLGQRSDVAELMPGADCFVFPTHYEPFGLVITEAMACGLPVITTRHAGAACVIADKIDGFLISDGKDIDGMIEALSNLKDSLRRNGIASAARKKAETLGWDRMAEKYMELLAC